MLDSKDIEQAKPKYNNFEMVIAITFCLCMGYFAGILHMDHFDNERVNGPVMLVAEDKDNGPNYIFLIDCYRGSIAAKGNSEHYEEYLKCPFAMHAKAHREGNWWYVDMVYVQSSNITTGGLIE